MPDFVVWDDDGVRVVGVRPARRVERADAEKFAVTARAAAAAGWSYLLVVGWHR
ncbi:hypothetical protein [Streptomyces sp. NPDC047841]|uniref:hypothetical protein n=1 Tax=Streptomyces sp. NPDC047841 TaxID=3154708 RepID=UPI0034545D5E